MAVSEFLEDEDRVSHLPALQLLCKLGYPYLTPLEVHELRDNRKGNALLHPFLKHSSASQGESGRSKGRSKVRGTQK